MLFSSSDEKIEQWQKAPMFGFLQNYGQESMAWPYGQGRWAVENWDACMGHNTVEVTENLRCVLK